MKKIFFLLAFSIVAGSVFSADIWVDVNGNDENSGTKESPVATITAAVRTVRELRRKEGEKSCTVHLGSGDFCLNESVFLRPEDSGEKNLPFVISGEKDGSTSISGGLNITGWKKKGHLLVANVPCFNGYPLDFRQMYINGEKAVRARDVSDFNNMNKIRCVDNNKRVIWVPLKAVKKILNAPYPEMVLHEMWTVANLRIKNIKTEGDSAAVSFYEPESRIQFEHFWPRPMVTNNGRNSSFYLTNAKSLLDKPGEWFYDRIKSVLYYYPKKGETSKNIKAIVPAVETLLNVAGTPERPVHDIMFKNITFKYSTWLRPSLKGHVPLQAGMYITDAYRIKPKMLRPDGDHKLDNQCWVGRPASAVNVSCAENIDFERCKFLHMGSTSVDYSFGTKGGKIEGCVFEDIAGNGILAGIFSETANETHFPYDPTDIRSLCENLFISNNYLCNIANEDWGCLGICAGYVRGINIVHNEICEVSYSGISLGWGWTQRVNAMRNNKIHANLIYHYAKHMYDVAGIYLLSAQPKTFVTENCVHSIYSPSYAHDPNHWFYLYTDEGSSFITVKNNWTEGEKFLKNANGPCNVWNNNGNMVNDTIKNNAGLLKNFVDIKY